MTAHSLDYDIAFYKSYYESTNPVAKRVATHGMYDCHAFHRFECSSVDDLINQWKEMSGPIIEKYGHPYLCPVVVLDSQGKELRRVGKMIDVADSNDDIQKFRESLLKDPDISRIMKENSCDN